MFRAATATTSTRRWNSTEAAANPKIDAIVDQIGQLTLLETANLVSSLKVRRAHPSSSGIKPGANPLPPCLLLPG